MRRGRGTDHAGLKRFAATAVILASCAGFAIETGRDSYSAQQPRSSTSIAGATTTTGTSSSTSSTTTTTAVTTTIPVSTRIEDPFHSASLAKYLESRTDNVTAALYNVNTHQTFIYRPDIDEVTASMEKIDILAVLLWESQNEHRALTEQEESLATKMIEYSDNKAAESLWVTIGQLPTVTEFNKDLHYSQSITSWDWGLFDTTPHDQLQLLKTILLPNKYLTPASQEYEQDLMQNVVDYERFGIPTGVPTNATVGVKNGWYPETTTGWQVNTAGYVHLNKTYYLAVVMTASNPSEAYGKEVVDRVAQAFWNFESSRANI
ncbi:MAG: serine hydrolase [Acidimicrobiales bacterium]